MLVALTKLVPGQYNPTFSRRQPRFVPAASGLSVADESQEDSPPTMYFTGPLDVFTRA